MLACRPCSRDRWQLTPFLVPYRLRRFRFRLWICTVRLLSTAAAGCNYLIECRDRRRRMPPWCFLTDAEVEPGLAEACRQETNGRPSPVVRRSLGQSGSCARLVVGDIGYADAPTVKVGVDSSHTTNKSRPAQPWCDDRRPGRRDATSAWSMSRATRRDASAPVRRPRQAVIDEIPAIAGTVGDESGRASSRIGD